MPDFVNRVILLKDGQANHGITDPEVLAKHAAQLTEDGITTTTVGYEQDLNCNLLTALVDAGWGNAYYVEAADQGVFVRVGSTNRPADRQPILRRGAAPGSRLGSPRLPSGF